MDRNIRGLKIWGASLLGLLNFGRWPLIFVLSQTETWFHITILVHRIVRKRLDFWKICRPLDYTVGLPRNSGPHAKAVQKFSDSMQNLVLSCSKLCSI